MTRNRDMKYIYIVKSKKETKYVIRIKGVMHGRYDNLETAIWKRNEIVKNNIRKKFHNFIYNIKNKYYVIKIDNKYKGCYNNLNDAICIRDEILKNNNNYIPDIPEINEYQLIRNKIWKKEEKYVKIHDEIEDNYNPNYNPNNSISSSNHRLIYPKYDPINKHLINQHLINQHLINRHLINIREEKILKKMFNNYINLN